MSFKSFHNQYKHLDIEESVEFYSVFDGHTFLEFIKLDFDLATCIQTEILDRIEEMKPYFIYDEDKNFQNDLESLLMRLAKGDRKNYTVYKKENISQIRGKALYKSLFEKGIIKKERSREKPIREYKGQLIKKALRRYEIQDKIHFKDNFTRFWFRFIAPALKNKKKLHVEDIIENIEQYISLCFEELSNDLIMHNYKKEEIINHGSYWDKNIEIDLLIEIANGTIIAGETKWKNHKVCKNILTTLQKKCERVELGADKLALFSKSGFSKELLKERSDNIMLFALKDFEVLYD